MKIKFLKEYKFLRGLENDVKLTTTRIFKDAIIDTVDDEVPDEDVQWLIDNGFAEEVKEEVKGSGWWKPNYGDKYYTIRSNGECEPCFWREDICDKCFQAIGNVFKTKEAAERFVDYLEAVETVRHDDGFMKRSRKIDYAPCGYGLYQDHSKSIVPSTVDCSVHAGEFYFDTYAHAQASLDKHRDEWRTILNYDWSKE